MVASRNESSRRVAERVGLTWERRTTMPDRPVDVLALDVADD